VVGEERPVRRDVVGDELPEDDEVGRDAPVLEPLVHHRQRGVHA